MSDETELKVKLTAEDGISAVIERVVESLGDTKLGHAITAASTAFSAASLVVGKLEQAFDAVNAKVQQSIDAAAEKEEVEKRLSAALLTTGNFTDESVEKFDHYAESLSRVTGMSDQAIARSTALGLSFGVPIQQAEAATEAAVNLAAAMGTDVNSAMQTLTMTLSGSAGRLSKLIPELKSFTEAELQNGAAITFLNEKYKNYAATLSDSYQGALNKTNLSHERFLEQVGLVYTKSEFARASLAAKAAMYDKLSAAVKSASEFLENNWAAIERVGSAMKAALLIYGTYFIAINAVTIATTAATIASGAFAAVMAVLASPITLTVLGVAALAAGFAYLGVSSDHVIGVFKILTSVALIPVTGAIGMMIAAIGKLVSIFDKDWGQSIESAGRTVADFGVKLGVSGIEQVKAGEAARKAAKDHKDHADVMHQGTIKVDAHEQAMRRLAAEYGRASENAKPALDALKDFAPRLSLLDWQRDQKNFSEQIAKMRESATIVIKTIQDNGGAKGASEAAMLQRATEDVQRASAAQTAIKIKDFEFVRENAIKNADIWVEYEKQKAVSASQEIMLKKIAAQEETRAKLIDIKTQELIQEQDLQRHYLTVEEEAKKNAYNTDLQAYKAMLDTRLQLAVDHETQKAIAQDQAAQSVVSLDPIAKAQVDAKLLEDVEDAHQQKLAKALAGGYVSQEAYDREYQASKLAQLKASHAEETAIHQEKADMLGMSEQAVKERQAEVELNYKDRIAEIEDEKLLSDQERKTAYEEAEMTHTANMNQVREQNIQDEITRADQMHDYWAVTLAKVRLEQERHGAIIGTIQGIAASQQFQAANKALGDLSSLRNSHSKKAFEVGKAAATGQAVINTFLAATGAYSAMAMIPIVGPVLGAMAAAAAIAAGIVNVQQIQSQKFNAAHGGIDSVPASLDNSTFLLKGGERVLQPAANQDMTAAAKKINEGGGSGNITIQITVYGDPSAAQLEQLKKSVIEGIRDASERGQPVINEKGIVRAS